MTRSLVYVIVETGPCLKCGHKAGTHGVYGECRPSTPMPFKARGPDERYQGEQVYGFVDMNHPESHLTNRPKENP